MKGRSIAYPGQFHYSENVVNADRNRQVASEQCSGTQYTDDRLLTRHRILDGCSDFDVSLHELNVSVGGVKGCPISNECCDCMTVLWPLPQELTSRCTRCSKNQHIHRASQKRPPDPHTRGPPAATFLTGTYL